MKLFPNTTLIVLGGALLLGLASHGALADERGHHDRRSWTQNPAYRQGWNHSTNRGWRDNRDHRAVDRHRPGNRYPSRYSPRYSTRYYPGSRDSWSVSLGLGSGYSSSSFWYGTGFNTGVGYGLYGNRWYDYTPYTPYRNRTVVVKQPTVVYVNESPRVSTRVTTPRPERSLLRDIDGNCFERHYDDRGVETRVRLPASACQF